MAAKKTLQCLDKFPRDRRRCTLTNIISRQVLLTEAAMSSEFGALLLTAIPKAASSTLLKVALEPVNLVRTCHKISRGLARDALSCLQASVKFFFELA